LKARDKEFVFYEIKGVNREIQRVQKDIETRKLVTFIAPCASYPISPRHIGGQ
jgi:hypothetical protein